ncbi:S-layer homology domain-containing protein [Paenibacillus xerothermodurans]|uniref:SLH domain-containing protein n=1 Tax=Paenibacillus xerothermodurans TaxID=1977292 RepID=A0A2W1N873_PAEXE|nr:S-layer homology domain-containing protein [Paenibacillus xerothermodurans]PZE20064.1 hypothetical protein CBW46_015400 [Paenibacillus xerothermodurans]
MSGTAFPQVHNVPFEDLSVNSPYIASIAKAFAAGMIDGYPGGLLMPDRTITKEEAAAIASRALHLSDQAEMFSDVADTGLFAGMIGAVVSEGILRAKTAVTFGFGDKVTVGDAASIALRVYNRLPFILMDATLPELQAAMQTGKTSSEKLVQQYLKRIETYDDQGPKINAMLAINPNALKEAAQPPSSMRKER